MASDAKVLTVESSPTEILASMTPAERKAWRETGATPELKEASPAEKQAETKTEDAVSSAAAKTETVETKVESAPAKTEPSKSRGKNAETRIPELLSEIKRLNSELETARKAPVAAQAKVEEVAKPRRADVDERGTPKYASDEAFDEAYESYLTAKVTKDVETRHAKQQAEARQAEVNRIQQEKWQTSLKLAIERHEDFAKVCEIDAKGAFQNAELKSIKTNGMVDAFVLDSEIGGSLLYYFAAHPGEIKRIEDMNSFAAARELTRLEDKLSATPSSVEKENPSEKEGSKQSVSKAPAPATSVGGRATAPKDEEEAATTAGDFRRYMKAANEAEFAKKKKAS